MVRHRRTNSLRTILSNAVACHAPRRQAVVVAGVVVLASFAVGLEPVAVSAVAVPAAVPICPLAYFFHCVSAMH